MRAIADRFAVILAFSLIMVVAVFAQDAQPDTRPGAGERFAQERSQERFQSRSQSNDRRDGRNQPGQFDFYVLALSWSPSFCESSRERNGGRSNLQQCAGERPYSFVVHGLWPQYERGFPRDCQVPAPRLSRNIVNTMLDIMPAPRLVFNQWDHHGTCSGMNGEQFFETVRKARETVQIPAQFTRHHEVSGVGAGRDREVLCRCQSGPVSGRHRRDLRPPALERSADLHVEGSAIPELP